MRRENLARAIMLSWGSLQSHLAASVLADKPNTTGNERFQAECVREYAEVIYTISVELHELTKLDFKETHESKGGK